MPGRALDPPPAQKGFPPRADGLGAQGWQDGGTSPGGGQEEQQHGAGVGSGPRLPEVCALTRAHSQRGLGLCSHHLETLNNVSTGKGSPFSFCAASRQLPVLRGVGMRRSPKGLGRQPAGRFGTRTYPGHCVALDKSPSPLGLSFPIGAARRAVRW